LQLSPPHTPKVDERAGDVQSTNKIYDDLTRSEHISNHSFILWFCCPTDDDDDGEGELGKARLDTPYTDLEDAVILELV